MASKDRGNQVRRNDKVKTISVNLYDIDSVIKYYFDNVIQPSVMEDGERINVPVVYGSPERWKSIQKTGIYRDKKNKVQFPAIVYKRTSVEKRKDLGNKVDIHNPLYNGLQKRYTQANRYDKFDILVGRQPQTEFHNIVIPDYVKLTYDCVVYTEYLEQLNKIVEDINYAGGQYWGQDNTFKFLSQIDSFDIESAAPQGEDRISKASFTITMNGFVIPDNVQKAMSNYNPKDFGKVIIKMGMETVATLEEINNKTAKGGGKDFIARTQGSTNIDSKLKSNPPAGVPMGGSSSPKTQEHTKPDA